MTARAAAASWSGRSASAWRVRSGAADDRLAHQALRLRAVGERLLHFAQDLEELQARSRALDRLADAQGLHVSADGQVAPLPAPASFEEHASAPQRAAARRQLVHRVSALAVDERAVHEQLVHDARRLADPGWAPRLGCASDGGSTGSDWAPGRGDAPTPALAAADAADRLGLAPGLLGKLGHPLTGGVLTAGADLAAGQELDDTTIKLVLTTGATAGVALATGAALTTAPVVVTALAVAGAGAAASYAGTRLFDAFGHHLPFVDAPSKRRRRCR